jgi:hypothetical protein
MLAAIENCHRSVRVYGPALAKPRYERVLLGTRGYDTRPGTEANYIPDQVIAIFHVAIPLTAGLTEAI